MDSEAGAKQAQDSFRCVDSDIQAIPALPSPPTAITNASPLRLFSQTLVSSAIQENMDVAAKLAQGRMSVRRASRLRWYWCIYLEGNVFPCPMVAGTFIDV
jgi:hypothetical protein